MTIPAVLDCPTVKGIHGMEFELTVRLPYLTVVNHEKDGLLYRVFASTRYKEGRMVYEAAIPVGMSAVPR